MKLHYAIYNPEKKTLTGIHQSGIYSSINCVRISLYTLISNCIFPEKISFEHTLHWYKDYLNEDYYNFLYKTDLQNIDKINKNFNSKTFCATEVKHKDLDFKNYVPIENVYFLPSQQVLENIDLLVNKYNINYSNTLAVLHRGNDKWKESKLLSVETWIQVIEENYKEGQRILIQTDEDTVKQKLLNYFKDRCFFFEEMIFENSPDTNIKPNVNKKEWSLNFESIMRIISKCNRIINHAGNCAMIPILYRGNTEGTVQIYNDEIIDHDKILIE
jgi:hypothetical protein